MPVTLEPVGLATGLTVVMLNVFPVPWPTMVSRAVQVDAPPDVSVALNVVLPKDELVNAEPLSTPVVREQSE